MSCDYQSLLSATIQYLGQLKAGGTQYVCVNPATLKGLIQPSLLKARPPGGMPANKTVEQPQAKPAQPFRPKISLSVPDSRGLEQPSPAHGRKGGPLPPGLSQEDKAKEIAALQDQALACVKCVNLVKARKHVVFGVGNIFAQLLFVGEAPGADEDRQGEPFVGAAGQLLTKIIQATGLSRQEVFIANILKCRPDTPGQTSGNRKPTLAEMSICFPWLERQIEIIQPKVIVALGATAVEGLLGYCPGITKMRGNWQSYRQIPVMPTYHPSYLLRNAAISEKRKVWEDMLQVMKKLAMPISEKQQNYFLQG